MVEVQTERREESEAEYDGHWSKVHALLERLLAAGETSLARMLALADEMIVEEGQRDFGPILQRAGFAICGQQLPMALPLLRESLAIAHAATVTRLLSLIEPGIEQIVELGSGTGRNLFHLWLNGGPPTARYVAAEYTSGGRRACSFLGAMERQIDLQVLAYDHLAPDLSNLDPERRTVFMTLHSIEQVPRLGEALPRALTAFPGCERVIHLEPVSWQMHDLPANPLLDELGRRWSEGKGYNRDLYPVLQRLEAQQELKILHREKHLAGAHASNTSACIVWEPVRAR